jgi:YhcH/YjgK/YiaL family protein
MIFDAIEHIGQYKGLSAHLDRAIDYILTTDFTALVAGRYIVDGEAVYCMVQLPALKEAGETRWEAHRRYIDIQLALAPGEAIAYAPLDMVEGWSAYDAEKDIQRAEGGLPGAVFSLRAGDFAIFFPQDAHRPTIRDGEAQTGHKVVLKVLAEEG